MHMNIVFKVCVFAILYTLYVFAGAAVVYFIEDYYDDDRRKGSIVSNAVAMILWPLTAVVFFVIEAIKYTRQKLNNKKE